jgi:hypothetical protein
MTCHEWWFAGYIAIRLNSEIEGMPPCFRVYLVEVKP